MKRLENFDREDLWNLRKQIVLDSAWYSDYHNDFGISTDSSYHFFEGYSCFLCELAKDNGYGCDDMLIFDNPERLEQWYYCFDSFDWVKYDKDTFVNWLDEDEQREFIGECEYTKREFEQFCKEYKDEIEGNWQSDFELFVERICKGEILSNVFVG